MIDLTSLVYALILGFGIFGLDAAWNANTVKTEFTVADSIGANGVKAEFATTVFQRELQEVFATESLVKAPAIRSTFDKTFVTILAESIGVKDATAAFQDLFGLDPVGIKATLTTEGKRTRLEVIGEAGVRGTFYLSLEGEEGETTVALIRRGAVEAALRLDPYHTALYYLDPLSGEPDVERAKRILDETIETLAGMPVSPYRARFRNLRGIVALLEGDKNGAATLFEQAIADNPTMVASHLNLAFTRVEQDRYSDAGMIVRHVLDTRRRGMKPALLASAHTILGVVAWSQKQYSSAERSFAAAAEHQPTVSDAYIYWGRMLKEIGQAARAREITRKGEANLPLFENYPEIALLYFWLSEKDNMPLQRRPRGNQRAKTPPS
jgi:tetratricopeptide (TPR) repeat protein